MSNPGSRRRRRARGRRKAHRRALCSWSRLYADHYQVNREVCRRVLLDQVLEPIYRELCRQQSLDPGPVFVISDDGIIKRITPTYPGALELRQLIDGTIARHIENVSGGGVSYAEARAREEQGDRTRREFAEAMRPVWIGSPLAVSLDTIDQPRDPGAISDT